MKFTVSLASFFITMAACSSFGLTVDFEELSTGPGGFYNGGPVTNSTGWTSKSVLFSNSYDSSFGGFWDGWSYSRVNKPNVGGFTNQYAAAAGLGAGGSATYAVGYDAAYLNVPAGYAPASVDLTNTAYTYFSLLNGDSFSRAFAADDYFTVTLTGYSGAGRTGGTTGSVTLTLADYRNGLSSIVNTWQSVSLTGLGNAGSVGLSFFSTDSGQFGINTPTYVAADNLVLTAVPEPALSLIPVLSLFAMRRSRKA